MFEIPLHIRHSNLLGSLSDSEVEQIIAASRSRHLASGDVVCHQGEQGDSMFILLQGRVSIDHVGPGGERRLLNYLGPGDHFGEMSLLVGGKRAANVTAVVDTQVLELKRQSFERLLSRIPGFAANLCRSLGEWLQGQLAGGHRPQRMQVGVVRDGEPAQGFAAQLALAVASQRGRLHVLSDQPTSAAVDSWHTLPVDPAFESRLLQQQSALAARGERVLVDVDRRHVTARLLVQNELVWWIVDADGDSLARATTTIRHLVASAPQLVSRIQLVVMMPLAGSLAPPSGQTMPLSQPPLRVQYSGSGSEARLVPRDIARATRQMRGLQLGIALGGGGARGLAHLGVLEVCEREGIYFDHVAGTSAGAIVAAAYAAGIPLAQIREVFARELTPPKLLRRVPRASQWYLFGVFRLGLAERKLRKYLFDYTFDQLLIPAQLVTVDLISGEHRLRRTGDVVGSVLESINHPVFGRPVLRNGEALVDGGVLMNVPVTALREAKVDLSVAVDVSRHFATTFGGNTPATPTAEMRQPGYFSTLLRVADVELRNLSVLHGSQCDFLIAPNTATFPFDDFSQVEGLVEAGRQAAEQALPGLKAALDDKLGWHHVPQPSSAGARQAA